MALSDTDLQRFHQQGYLLVPKLLDAPTLARLQSEVEGLHERMAADTPERVQVSWEDLEPGHPPRIRQLMNSEQVCPTIDAISRSDTVLDIMEQVIGPDLLLFHSKLMMKSAHDGTFTPWHQDWGYWQHQSSEPSQVNCMLAIDPATIENGCIRFVPGSHLQGPVDHKTFASSSFNTGLDGDIDAFEADVVEMEPGDAVFFGALVIHGSAPNTSAQHRRANTFAFDRVGNSSPELPIGNLRRGRYPVASG